MITILKPKMTMIMMSSLKVFNQRFCEINIDKVSITKNPFENIRNILRIRSFCENFEINVVYLLQKSTVCLYNFLLFQCCLTFSKFLLNLFFNLSFLPQNLSRPVWNHCQTTRREGPQRCFLDPR